MHGNDKATDTARKQSGLVILYASRIVCSAVVLQTCIRVAFSSNLDRESCCPR
jgi:hypothetical protein